MGFLKLPSPLCSANIKKDPIFDEFLLESIVNGKLLIWGEPEDLLDDLVPVGESEKDVSEVKYGIDKKKCSQYTVILLTTLLNLKYV